ncbi:Hexose transporter HXT9 [Frankliniella fusca]|uniref:Hexose transporter HXT9 n=1 Tax=Frankliniella fusca TaxID=407009 RepID=A0AAE1H0K2_9NEOP|nr:Hexose transporter HXT9 [Frankliniella fusca]
MVPPNETPDPARPTSDTRWFEWNVFLVEGPPFVPPSYRLSKSENSKRSDRWVQTEVQTTQAGGPPVTERIFQSREDRGRTGGRKG